MRTIVTLSILMALAALGALAQQAEDEMSIGERFHYLTSFGEQGFVGEATFGQQVPLFKHYEDARVVDLPEPGTTDMPVSTAINKRRSQRSYADRPLTQAELSRVLVSANGVTRSGSSHPHRGAPSAGGLYPIELYVLVHNVEELENGIYHFQPEDTTLELIKTGQFAEQINQVAMSQEWVGASPVTLICTARWDRVTVKYADRGYRYAYIEAGAVCQNVYLQCTAANLATVVVGAYNDLALNRLLNIDQEIEAGLWIMPVGHPG